MAADRRDSRNLDITDKDFYTVLGAMLDHDDIFQDLAREGISNQDFKNKVREWLQIELKDEQVENFRRIMGQLRRFKDSNVYFKPRC
jgi:hypothetical protein